MEILRLIGIAAVGGGLCALLFGLRGMAAGSKGALVELGHDFSDDFEEPSGPLLERLFEPAKGKLGRLGRTLTPQSQLEKMRRRAILAGKGAGGVESVLAIKGVATVAGAVLLPLGAAAGGIKFGNTVLFALAGAAFGFYIPDVSLSRKGRKRQQEMRSDLPETIDLIAISVQAGMGLEAAVELASQSLPGALGDEFHRLLQEIQLGSTRKEALHHLRDRTEVSELSSFAMALIQADAIGSPIAEVLQSNSARMRLIRRQNAREKAAKLPVKLLVPMMLFIFPAIFVVVIGPAAISIAGKF